MSYTKQNYTDVEEQNGLHMMRNELGCENLGVTVTDVEAGWQGMTHDHGDNNHEEVYFLASGDATLIVEGEEIDMSAGDAVRVDPESERQLEADEDSVFVIAGAP